MGCNVEKWSENSPKFPENSLSVEQCVFLDVVMDRQMDRAYISQGRAVKKYLAKLDKLP